MLNAFHVFLDSHIHAAAIGALLALGGLLALAAWHDMKRHRIPNALVASGIALGLLLHSLIPTGFGFAAQLMPGGLGALVALQGLAVGFAVFFPLYLMRASGAGDVKLMAMVGTFAGPFEVLGAAMLTFVVGLVLAVAVACRKRVLRKTMHNLKTMSYGAAAAISGAGRSFFPSRADTAVHVPYAIAIGLGSGAWLLRGLVV